MSARNQLAVYLPFALAVLLVGTAIAGSRMSEVARRKMQRLVLMPLLALVGLGCVWLAVVEHDYPRAGILALMVILTLPRLFSKAASPRQGRAS